MESTAQKQHLVPTPEALVTLVKELVECDWPETDDQRVALFLLLGFESRDEFERSPEDSNVRSFELATALPGEIFGTWDSYKGRFMGINLHPYSILEPGAAIARRGHDALQTLLTSVFGEPVRPWDDEEVPPSIWKVNGRDIVMHFFHRRDSGVMLSIDDAELAAAAEAEAAAR